MTLISSTCRKDFKPTTARSGIFNKRAAPRASKTFSEPEVAVKEEKRPEVKAKAEPETSKPKSSIEQMFGKQKEKETSAAAASTEPKTSAPKPSVATKKAGSSIAGLFAKQVTRRFSFDLDT